ncbi:glycoside hydrolase family 16 protein [Streptomyces benahoarensis]|uniref:Family 16 glycosylhydrolase n=1 Tax=Streptomyces benahoarensis TaxID=2595054 RepID=A0A553ZQ48_9ACTN|nr:glycoside hydrolase family 16 protein [Streptomyces benahoarensis]TSB31383.1 family 16 glycosylhydrolase [Streptomyces benahoarensis]TSB43587.1 family 16 glycosylhydrolase [Streptomyces benahoarensis]
MIMEFRAQAVALACALAFGAPFWSSPSAAPVKEAAPAFQEVWRADFDGAAGSRPSADDWITDTGTGYPGGPGRWGTGEVQTYTDAPENLQLDGAGHLKITAREKDGGWTSGRIETRRTDFAAPEGGALRIEARIELPAVSGDKALGYWPAFWTLGADFRGTYSNWPGVGEFDVMENVNGADTLWGTLHCGVSPGGPCNETQGKGSSRPCTGCRDDFHTYALALDRTDPAHEKLTWYLDGAAYHTVAASEMDADTWARATHHGHFLLIDLAMGGGFPDGVAGRATPTDTTAPGASLLVDNVAVSVARPASARTP